MIHEILWLASWPVFLWLSYKLSIITIKRLEKIEEE